MATITAAAIEPVERMARQENADWQSGSPPSASVLNPDIPDRFDQLLQQMHSSDVAGRISSAEQLEPILEQELSCLQQPEETRELPARQWMVRQSSLGGR